MHELHGYQIAKEIKERQGSKVLLGHGTLYRALASLEKMGLLVSRWEDEAETAEERRPRRKLYRFAFPPSSVRPEFTELYDTFHRAPSPLTKKVMELMANVRKTTTVNIAVVCPRCDQGEFTTPDALWRHMRAVHEDWQ